MDGLAIKLSIGAVLAGSFQYTIASAPKQLAKIGDAIGVLNRQSASVKLLQGAESNLEKSRAKLARVNQELLRVKAAMRGADGKELADLTARAGSLERQQTKLSASVERGRNQVRQAAAAHRDAAAAVDSQASSLKRMGGTLEQVRAREEALQNAMAKHGRAQTALAKARGGLFDAVAIGAGFKMAFAGAGELQAVLTDIGITADLSKEKMADIGTTLGELSTKTGQNRVALAQGLQVLVAAGLDSDRAVASMEAIGKTATASGAEVEDVAKTVFSLLDNLQVDPGEALQAMDMLVAAGKAGRFELKDMAKYFPAMTAEAAKLGLKGIPFKVFPPQPF